MPPVAAAPAASPHTPAASSAGAGAEVTLDSLMRAQRRVTINSDAAEQCQYMVLSLARRDEGQPMLPRPFLRTLAALQLQDLRAYIAARLVRASRAADGSVLSAPAPCRPEAVLLYVNGAPVMGREHTLQFVIKTQWRREEDLVMQYAVAT